METGKEQCPNGCGELEVANGRIDTNDGATYFKVSVEYCPKCMFINYSDANL